MAKEIASARTLIKNNPAYDTSGAQHKWGEVTPLNKTAYDCSGALSATAQTKYNSVSGLLNPENRKSEFIDVTDNTKPGTWTLLEYEDSKGKKDYHAQMTMDDGTYFDAVPKNPKKTDSREGPSTTTTSTEEWLGKNGYTITNKVYIQPRQ